MERRMVERQIRMIVRQRKNIKNDGKTKEERWKKNEMTKNNDGKKKKQCFKERRKTKKYIDRIKNMEEKRQKKKIFCIIDLL